MDQKLSQSPLKAVLVVEDEPLLLLDGMCLFEDAGFEAVPAANAAEAICCLEERGDIGVVITDIGMPGIMDGLSLCTSIRERWPHIELIVISGHEAPPSGDLPSRCVFLSKPYEVPHLLEVIRGFVGNPATI